MEVNNVNLEAVAVKPEQYPQDGLPEVAFVGKSNVGKSSLINAMVNRNAYARVSGTPGKTRTLNFYKIEEALYFVDLPGYGYAKAPKSQMEKWGSMIENYLLKRQQLKRIILLLDIRHEPGANDRMMYDWLKHYNHTIIIVATKSDKLKRSQTQRHVSIIRKALGMEAGEIILPFSSEHKTGRDELWQIIETATDQNTGDSVFM
jgi:GTP-binding protein